MMALFQLSSVRRCSITLSAWLLGCTTMTSHENFVDALNRTVGTSVDIVPMFSLCSQYGKNHIESFQLSNGNIENKYFLRRKGICTYFCEVDPKTRKVVRVRFEGRDEDCAIVP